MSQRFVRVAGATGPVWGVVAGDEVRRVDGPPWLGGAAAGPSLGAVAEAALLAPAMPSKVVCVGRNYGAHAAERGAEVPSEPLLFLKPPSSIIGPGMGIVLPPQSEHVDHEGELALVMGRRCRGVDAAGAWAYVAGITCANDVSARDLQRRDGQWTRAKGFDTFCPLGPWLAAGVSEAEVAELTVSCRVNGELRQRGATREMAFPPAVVVAYVASVMTLEPGDVILTGTPAGVGPLSAGDVVEVEVSGVGVLRNPVV